MIRIQQVLRTFLVACMTVVLLQTSYAQGYEVDVEARADAHDRIRVTIQLPPLTGDSSVVVFPVTVPGTYEEHLWWRLVSNFQALDPAGKNLATTRTADSQFVVPRNTATVRYLLDDSFDDTDPRVSVFHPTGTSFQGDSVFVLNHGGIVGYVYGQQKLPFTVRVHHKPGIETQTALRITQRTAEMDEYVARSYDELVDGPALVCTPDTTSFMVKDMQIVVSVYSEHPDAGMAKKYAIALQRTTEAIGRFLPTMPVKRYVFLIYLWSGDNASVRAGRFSQGALEHGTSSLYFWRDGKDVRAIEDIAAHEFLHILVPLNLHSKEIGDFDFRWPTMSKHLWLYEGVTDYFAHLALLRGGVYTDSLFVREMDHCARSLSRVPSGFTLTTFSKNVLTEENQKLYPLIYEYGPLNALLLDITIRKETHGAKGILEVIYELMQKYGPTKSFDDDDLFAEIGRVTGPTVVTYLQTYVADSNRIPLKELLPSIGWEFKDSLRKITLTFGVRFDEQSFSDTSMRIGPGKENPLGLMKNDILREIDGHPINTDSLDMFTRLWHTESSDPITLVIERGGKRITLTAPPVEIVEVARNVIQEAPSSTPEQLAFRKIVLMGR